MTVETGKVRYFTHLVLSAVEIILGEIDSLNIHIPDKGCTGLLLELPGKMDRMDAK